MTGSRTPRTYREFPPPPLRFDARMRKIAACAPEQP
jgi:hypothetical protein